MFSIMLHWIKAPDRQVHLHDHPVSMLSVVLKGFYIEEGVEDSCLTLVIDGKRFDACLSNYTKVVRSVNWIPATKRHRISAVRGDVLTLCFAGRRKREWGFYTEDGWMQWQEYHKQYGGNTS
jgi:hypothetical protein